MGNPFKRQDGLNALQLHKEARLVFCVCLAAIVAGFAMVLA